MRIESTSNGMGIADFVFEENTWYKLTVTGKPQGEKCQQTYAIEGPLTIWGDARDKYEGTLRHNDCLVLDAPLKVYATTSMTISTNEWYYDNHVSTERRPMNGVVRNIAFTNTETDTTMNTIC